MTSYEQNTTGVAFNNWTSRFGHSIQHYKLTAQCLTDADMYIDAVSTEDIGGPQYCGQPAAACLDRTTQVHGGHNDVIHSDLFYDWDYFAYPYSAGQSMHLMAHEFGHGMALAHHGACGGAVMSPPGCTDMVDNGPYPNDVCEPDRYLGYFLSRC